MGKARQARPAPGSAGFGDGSGEGWPGGGVTVRIYTRTGDAGETGLLGGVRVAKDHRRIEACGALDELNAALGLVLAHLDGSPAELLYRLQEDCFRLGAELASPESGKAPASAGSDWVSDEDVIELERAIDRWDAQLPPLRQFILPGGTPAGAAMHLARAVARRAERRVVALAAVEPVRPTVLRYLNRLSDLLFVLARWVNHSAGATERPWGAAPWRGARRGTRPSDPKGVLERPGTERKQPSSGGSSDPSSGD